MPRQRQRRGHFPAISVDVVGIQRAQGCRGGGRDRGECTEQSVGVMRAVTLDEFRVVEVVAGVEPNVRGRAARSSCSWSAERSETFTPSTFALCSRTNRGTCGSRSVCRSSPSSRSAGVEHLAQPVQDDWSSRLASTLNRPEGSLRRCSDGRQLARGHQDHLRAGRLDELDLLEIGAGDLAEAARRYEELIGARAGRDPGPVLASDGRAAADQSWVAGQSRPILRCAVSMASATPSP